jgi:hypothetical protein
VISSVTDVKPLSSACWDHSSCNSFFFFIGVSCVNDEESYRRVRLTSKRGCLTASNVFLLYGTSTWFHTFFLLKSRPMPERWKISRTLTKRRPYSCEASHTKSALWLFHSIILVYVYCCVNRQELEQDAKPNYPVMYMANSIFFMLDLNLEESSYSSYSLSLSLSLSLSVFFLCQLWITFEHVLLSGHTCSFPVNAVLISNKI